MSDLGLGNLIELKRQLLNATLLGATTYDAPITAIGKGVAKYFEGYCNRKFARVVADQFTLPADRAHVFLPRYPVESIATIEQRDNYPDGFRVLAANTIQQLDPNTGYVFLGAQLGMWFSLLRFTYTGGFWYDTTEDGSGALPAGATALPDDLRLAWYMHCADIWDRRDKLGISLTQKPEEITSIAKSGMSDQVKDTLKGLVRYSMT